MNGSTKKIAAGGTAGLTLAGLMTFGWPIYRDWQRDKKDLRDQIVAERILTRERLNQIEMDSCTRDAGWHWYGGGCVRED